MTIGIASAMNVVQIDSRRPIRQTGSKRARGGDRAGSRRIRGKTFHRKFLDGSWARIISRGISPGPAKGGSCPSIFGRIYRRPLHLCAGRLVGHVLAMILHGLNRPDEAKAALAEAKRLLSDVKDEDYRKLGERLSREASGLIEP